MNKMLILLSFSLLGLNTYADQVAQDACIAQFSNQCLTKCQNTNGTDCVQRCQEDAKNQCRQAGE
jgi:hypothetical protein